MTTQNIGLIGLGVMGKNLALNFAEHGFKVFVYNRSELKTREFLNETEESGFNIFGFYDLKNFVSSLERPRKILLMVKAGDSVDKVIKNLVQFLEPGDLVADLGNSFYEDTIRREAELLNMGIFFAGVGVSGGEEGARRGPSIMPGGNIEAKNLLESILILISAEVIEKEGGASRCCKWVGSGGSGHFVKMVHNGIEYGDMQIIAEVYKLMTMPKGLSDFRLTNEEAADVFIKWDSTELAGYLNEITSKILRFREPDGSYLVDKIRDTAGQKGTGKWTVTEGVEFNQPLTVISEAVFARYLSADMRTRTEAIAAADIQTPDTVFSDATATEIIEDLKAALLGARIISYLQGFILIQDASDKFLWDIDLAVLAEIWRGGCIIRSSLLQHISDAYKKNNELKLFITDDYFKKLIKSIEPGWRRTAARAAVWGCPVPGIVSALTYFDAIRTECLSTNLIQAQRDFFGSHMYERVDKADGQLFHTSWQRPDSYE